MEKRRSTRVRQSVIYKEQDESIIESSRKSINPTFSDSENVSPKKLRNNRTPSTKALESIVLENSPTTVNFLDTPRRSTRIRTPGSAFQDIDRALTKHITRKRKKSVDLHESVIEIGSSSEAESDHKENVGKPTTLFNEEQDVEGRKLYSFKTPKKKDGMSSLASLTPKTPRHNDPNKTPRTPKDLRLSEIQKTPTSRPSAAKCTKTPRHVRDEIKKKLYKVKYHDESDDGDFSADDSDFEPSSSAESDESDSSSDTTVEPVPIQKESVASRVLKTPSTRSTRGRKTDYQYVLQSDDFFSTQTTKSKTSDHTLDRLKTPRLPHDQLVKLLSRMELSSEHQHCVKDLNKDYKFYFDKWMFLLDQGYSIMLHGLGSKRNLLHSFHKEKLSQEHVLVVNGFFPSLTIKDILEQLANDLLELTVCAGNSHETVNIIEEEMRLIPELHVYLLIHNIDGAMLRNEKAQSVLSRLAGIKNIHLVASIDHINAPLLWNNTKLSNFNFAWYDVTSYLPYTDETAFENSMLINNSGALELSSMKSVFQSLTSNAKGIYMILVKFQLKNATNQNYQGMVFKDLYSACREAFLVSSDVALRAQLTEFLDHKLAKMKRNLDGAENITIPINNALLQKFVIEQGEK